jgi:cyclophilin family peptidyl-prolyl cis-trans isomerase
MHRSTVALLVASLALVGCAKKSSPTTTNPTPPAATVRESPAPDVTLSPKESSVTDTQRSFPGVIAESERLNKQATITLANGQVIVIELFGDEAPKAASNFVTLARDHFYDGLTFHRVEPGFVAQGGDPKGNGTGGPGYQFEDEPVTRDYTQGIVAMANSGPNTNGSQFFILLADTPLPKQYTIFGRVTAGLDAVLAIRKGDVMKTVAITDR